MRTWFCFVVKPNIVPFHFEDPIFAGQATQVTCLISEGDLPLFIDWTFQESEVASLNGVTSTNLGKRMSVLLIEQAQYEHTGNYTCRASNSAGVSNYTATLYVNGKSKEYLPGTCCRVACHWFSSYFRSPSWRNKFLPHQFSTHHEFIVFSLVLPKITAFDFGEDAIFSGQSAQASCFVSEGSEPVTISWSYQGKEIGTVKEISITKVGRKASILVIEPALSQHQGNYTCSAHNAAGTTNYTATLNINGTLLLNFVSRQTSFDFLQFYQRLFRSRSATNPSFLGKVLSWLVTCQKVTLPSRYFGHSEVPMCHLFPGSLPHRLWKRLVYWP